MNMNKKQRIIYKNQQMNNHNNTKVNKFYLIIMKLVIEFNLKYKREIYKELIVNYLKTT